MKTIRWLFPLAALLTVACAHAAGKHTDYAQFAGEPITSFRYTNLYNWQRVGDHDVALWTKPSEAYLLDLVDNCQPVESRYTVEIGGVASVGGVARVGDDVNFGPLHCRILAIRPIDLARMKQK